MNKDSCLTEITLLQLRTFVNVVERRGIRRAAEEMYLDPSTVHAHLHNLETSLGLKLVLFEGREPSLTEAGEILFESAKRAAGTLCESIKRMNNLKAGVRGRVRIAAIRPVGTYLIIPAVNAFKAHSPYADLEVTIGRAMEMLESLLRGECDLAICSGLPSEKRALACSHKEYFADVLVWVKPVASEPQPKTLIVRETGSRTRRALGSGYISEFETIIEVHNTEETKRQVVETRGVGIVSLYTVLDELRVGTLELCEKYPPIYNRTFYFIFKNDPPLSPLGRRFVEFCRQRLPCELARNPLVASIRSC